MKRIQLCKTTYLILTYNLENVEHLKYNIIHVKFAVFTNHALCFFDIFQTLVLLNPF